MKSEKKLGRKLKELQQEHARELKKVEKAQTKFQKRGQQLRVLEQELAELEKQYHKAFNQVPEAKAEQLKPLRHARLLYNPNSAVARDGKLTLEQILDMLREHGVDAEPVIKTSSKVIREAASEAAKNGDELLIVAGGDGTIEKVAAQLVGSETTLGILPIGTMNNLARSLGVPLDIADACALIGMGVSRQIDIGHVDVKAKKHVKYFLETAGLGLSAIALPLGQEMKKGVWHGLPGALKKIIGFKPSAVSVELDDGQVLLANASVVTVSNAPLMGLNFLIAPDAKMDDGWLDVAIYDGVGKSDIIGQLMAAHNSTIVDNPKIKKYKARHVQIRSQSAQPRASDKDVLQEDEVLEINIIPQALRVIVGRGIGLTFPVDVSPSTPPLKGEQPVNGHEKPPAPKSEVINNSSETTPVAEPEPA